MIRKVINKVNTIFFKKKLVFLTSLLILVFLFIIGTISYLKPNLFKSKNNEANQIKELVLPKDSSVFLKKVESQSLDNRYSAYHYTYSDRYVAQIYDKKIDEIVLELTQSITKDYQPENATYEGLLSYIVWVPNTNRISYIKNGELIISDINGENKEVLVSGVAIRHQYDRGFEFFQPEWSPSGRFVAFQKGKPHYEDFCILDTQTGQITRIEKNTEHFDLSGDSQAMLLLAEYRKDINKDFLSDELCARTTSCMIFNLQTGRCQKSENDTNNKEKVTEQEFSYNEPSCLAFYVSNTYLLSFKYNQCFFGKAINRVETDMKDGCGSLERPAEYIGFTDSPLFIYINQNCGIIYESTGPFIEEYYLKTKTNQEFSINIFSLVDNKDIVQNRVGAYYYSNKDNSIQIESREDISLYENKDELKINIETIIKSMNTDL